VILVFVCGQAAHVHVHEKHDGNGGHKHGNAHGEKVQDAFNSVHNHGEEHNENFDHEAVLGNREKAKEFDSLTPEESKRRLELLVTKEGMDANGDGFVDSIELSTWVLHSFKNLAVEDGLDRFEEEDLDEDGYVSWSEHLKDNFDIENEDMDQIQDKESQSMVIEDKALWKAADADKDGRLNRDEFPAFNTPEEFEHMKDIMYQLTLVRRDKNGDGLLDLNEFLLDENGQLPDRKSDLYTSEKDKFEKDYDVDKDGFLNRKEVLLWIIPDNDDMSAQEAEHLILSSDDDGDGKLSVSEIVSHHDIFVGSEATDYGERLNSVRDEL
jgi:Ca2+-binding EF-hand superfamily protein